MTSLQVWAPAARSVAALVDGSATPLEAAEGGWWRADVPAARSWRRLRVPARRRRDTAARTRGRAWQPHGVHGASRVYDHARFAWTDAAWRGVALPGSVVYELHVGTFTAEGTLDAALERLDHLVVARRRPGRADAGGRVPRAARLGVRRRAPVRGARALRRAGRARSGSSTPATRAGSGSASTSSTTTSGRRGNYLPRFGPYFTGKHETPWGAGVNLDDEGAAEVRRWVIDNALMWLRDYHVDALRLDAVHALADDSPRAPAGGAVARGRRALAAPYAGRCPWSPSPTSTSRRP